MKSKSVSRRVFLNDAALMAVAACLAGCTKTVTKYHPDGTPYTVEEEDPVTTLAGVLLLLLVIAGVAAASNDDSSSKNYDDDWLNPEDSEGKVHLAQATSRRTRSAGTVRQGMSIKGPEGKLLASVDSFERVKHHDLDAAARLLANAQVSNLDQPVTFRLQQERLDSYRIEDIRVQRRLSRGKSRVFTHQIKGRLYEVRVYTNDDGSLGIEVVERRHDGQGVA